MFIFYHLLHVDGVSGRDWDADMGRWCWMVWGQNRIHFQHLWLQYEIICLLGIFPLTVVRLLQLLIK